MDIAYKDTESLVPNTKMQKMFVDGVHKTYIIQPEEGYKLHDIDIGIMVPEERIDEDTGVKTEVEVLQRGYTSGSVSCGAAYDFAQRTIDIDGVPTGVYGDREFFTVKKGED